MRRSDPILHDCRSDYPARHHGGERFPSSIRYIVLHSTEGGTAESVARYFYEENAPLASANLVVDDLACYRCLGDNVIPWAAPPLNTRGFHIEQAGFADWGRSQWLQHRKTIQRAAYKAALRCRWYSIPPDVLDIPMLIHDFGRGQLEGGVPARPGPLLGGIITHASISAAFHQSNHYDPGAGYPMDVFLNYLHGFLRGWRPNPRLAATS